ncbi:MAG: class II aldolase/adducin family protein [Pseudomonadota bacterium]
MNTTPTQKPATAPIASGINVPDPTSIDRLEGKVSDAEWTARIELAALYRLCALYGWTDLVFTHISARLPDEDGEERFLINPYGVMFDEMTASSLVKVDLEGKIQQETPFVVNPAGFTIHSAVHMAREDAGCVVHLHTPYGVAVSMQKPGLRRYSQFALIVGEDLAYHDYEGIALDLDERERIVADLGSKNALLLKNHGTLTVGQNCAIAFLRAYFLEMACKTQIFGQSIADESQLLEEPPEMGLRVAEQSAPAFMPGMGDALVWPGLMRRLNRINPGYDH